MEDYAPSIFLVSWALVVLYLCFRFHIFNKLNLKSMSFKYILEDDSISSTFKAHICFCSNKGAGL
jgi:hypothetical protein